jgi:hypothetical protein
MTIMSELKGVNLRLTHNERRISAGLRLQIFRSELVK